MNVDFLGTIVIERPVAEVSRYAPDPGSASLWYANIKSVE
jgi:hypothetical protein